MVKDNLIFIRHMIENIEKIELFSKDVSLKELIKDELKQYAITRALEIIGEAAKNISDNFKDAHNEISWKNIIGTRDKIIHHYFGINMEIVWDIIKIDLPNLKKQLEKIQNGENKK